MGVRCSLCKRHVDMEEELACVFECYVYCGECLEQMERKERMPPSNGIPLESDLQDVQ